MLHKGVQILHRIEDTLLVTILLAMVTLAFSQIVMRNFLGTGSIWLDPLLRVLVLWVGLLGALVATRQNKQISVDVLTRFLPERLKTISDIITRTFAAIISAIIAWHSFLFLIDEWNSGAMAFASVPAWLPESIIPIGFAIIALRYAFQVLVLISQSFREHGKQ
ncbi:MAG: TRAP transporter small permease subunit [Gammaproteobacteria bacterium]|nr:TRAP transporter small permease subunit [Gammaproteobacteria bacterium]MDX2488156.1 TRAP transporter small permease subunit [Gammaproteobacteria bacterium]